MTYDRNATPRTKWVYHTSDTYIAGALTNAILKGHEGSSKDLFTDIIVGELWTPLNLSATAKYTRRTYDTTAQPFAGWGLMWTRGPDRGARRCCIRRLAARGASCFRRRRRC